MQFRRILCLILSFMAIISLLPACAPQNMENKTTETTPAAAHHPDFPNVDITGMTDLQKAVVLTAESYVLRQERGQYDDTRLTDSKSPANYRWATGLMQPEDYTSQFAGYSNCAAFVHDLYLAALDFDIKFFTTATLTQGSSKVLFETPVLSKFDTLDASALETKKQEFLNTLQPGDLIVYRYADKSSGHAMCYVGNNMMIHCTGSNYNYTERNEKYEEIGCFRYDPIDTLFEAGHRRYLFDKQSYSIIRPLDNFRGEIPQRTKDRMTTMRGIMAEKTASALWTQTVNPGQEVTFTFTLQNLTGENKTLTVTDTVPKNTTYVSGAQTQNGNALSWSVTIPARETATVSYTVQVGDSADFVESSSFVEHIPVNCPAIRVGKTLTPEEQEALGMMVYLSSDISMALLPNAYRGAFDTEILSGLAPNDFLEGVFRYYSEEIENGIGVDSDWPEQWRSLDENGVYYHLVPPGLYGGRNVVEGTSKAPCKVLDFMAVKRTRLVTEEQLIPGDIIIANDSETAFDGVAWFYINGKLMNLQTGEEIPPEDLLPRLICYKHFVVIRPSLGM